jgi:glycosyltransferase involved in cell wall biosynthesis
LSIDALEPQLTGIGRYVWELASRLPKKLGADAVRYYRNGHWIEDTSLLLQPQPVRKQIPARMRIRKPRWFRERIMQWSCRGRVFHGPNYFLPPCADIGVATIHDLSVFKFPETHPVERIKQFERDFASSMSRAAHLITDSEATRQEVIDYLAWPVDKITAVPLGVSTVFMPRASAEMGPRLADYGLLSGFYALCVSTIEPRKRIGNLLKAYQTLAPREREQYPLVLVGTTGWLSDALHAEIDHLQREGWLRYLEFVPEEDLPLLYAGARTFVYPSGYEGFGLPVLEAMASGVPVITSNVSALPEVTQGAALLVDTADIDALASGIIRGLSDDAWRADAITRGLIVARSNTWDRCVEQTVRVYEHVAQGEMT